MVPWGAVLFISMSTSAGFTVAGAALGIDLMNWLGMIGLAVGCMGFDILLKSDFKKQRLDCVRVGRAWPADAVIIPPWAIWTVRALVLALIAEAQLTLNSVT